MSKGNKEATDYLYIFRTRGTTPNLAYPEAREKCGGFRAGINKHLSSIITANGSRLKLRLPPVADWTLPVLREI